MINDAALSLIKKWEGFRPDAYKDPIGVWTIGYGTTANAGVGITPKAGMTISEGKAAAYLDAAVTKFAHNVTAVLTKPANENEFGAMVSLAYNIGPTAFMRSTVLRKFNEGDKKGAADAFLLWNKAGGRVMKGLINRRIEERALFLRPVADRLPVDHVGGLTAFIKAILKLLGVK